MWPFDQNNHQVYQQYAQGYDSGNYSGLDPFQAIGHIQQFLQSAPSDMQQQVYQQHFEQMPYEQRALLAQRMPPEYQADANNPWSMAQNFMRMGREQPHLLHGVLNHPLLLGAGLGLAGLIAKHVIEHHHRNQGQQQYADAYNQSYQNNYPQNYQNSYSQNNGQNAYFEQELTQERAREQELQNQLRYQQQEIERLENQGQQHHHHHHNNGF